MSHGWRSFIESVGPASTTAKNNAKANRDAFIAAMHATASAEDDALWNALLTALGNLTTALDPGGTGRIKATISGYGAHAGWASAGASISIQISQEAQPDPAAVHVWQTMAGGRLTSGEITLAQNLLNADLTVQSWTANPQDSAVFGALVAAIQTVTATIDPNSTGTISGSMSASVSVGDLRRVTASFNISSTQPAASDQLVVKPSSQASSVTTLADITGLVVPLIANATYQFEYWLPFRSAALTTGLGLAMNGPVSPALITYNVSIPFAVDGADAIFEGVGTAYEDVTLSTGVVAINTDYLAKIDGIIRTGAAGGNLAPRVRSEVAASAVTIQQGAAGLVRKIA